MAIPHSHLRLRYLLFIIVLLEISTRPARAQAGPPYLTDDPDPVTLHHFEAYAFELSDSTPKAGTAVTGPSYEMNWGAAPNLQLHLVVPFVTVFTPNQPFASGFGDIELGAKYQFHR